MIRPDRQGMESGELGFQVSVSLSFDGHCEEAFAFYERHLGARVTFKLAWGHSPLASQAPPEWQDKLLHATLRLGDTTLLGADALPGSYKAPTGFSILLGLDDPARAEETFDRLGDQGTVGMPLQETFWAKRFGIVTDRFGIPWEINCGER